MDDVRVRMVASLAVAMILTAAAPASAATFTVTNTNNSGGGSLRASITAANAAPGADTVAFNILVY
jgi:hypothetical protein